MAREQFQERRQAAETATVDQPIETAGADTAHFSTHGQIPPVETAVAAPQPTASERAYGKGPGVEAAAKAIEGGAPKADAIAGIIDAHRDEHDAILALVRDKLGASFADNVRSELSHVRASISRKELVTGDPGDPASGYLLVSQKEGGAKWKTAGGGFTGTANKDGLDSKLALGEHDALHAHAGKDKTGTLAWEHDGKNEGEAFGKYGSGKDYEIGLRRNWDVAGGTLTTGASHHVTGQGATDGVFANYKKDKTSINTNVGMNGGEVVGGASLDTQLAHDHLQTSIAHDKKGTSFDARDTHDFGHGFTGTAHLHQGPEGTTGELGGAYKDDKTNVDANIARGVDKTSLHLGASHQLTPELSLKGAADHVMPDKGHSQTSLSLSERYKSGNVLQGLDLSLGHGAQDYVKASGSVDAKLAPNLYGGMWAGAASEAGHQTTAQLGASLTFSTNEKTALTLAGVMDHTGRLETRLQFDVFKSKVESISDLDKQKKDALLSLFVSYSTKGTGHMLDDRFGAPSIDTPVGNQVTAGIKIRF